jgi:hypothetical protein
MREGAVNSTAPSPVPGHTHSRGPNDAGTTCRTKQGSRTGRPPHPLLAKGVHPVLAGSRRLRASTALERPLATRPDSLLRGGAAGERRVAAIAHAQPSTSHSAPGEGFRFARGWRKQKRWINGRSGDQAEALGDRAAACLLARRCKHHGVAGVRSIAMEIADARAIRTIAFDGGRRAKGSGGQWRASARRAGSDPC